MDRQALQERFGLNGESPAIKQVVDKVMQIAKTDITVLLQGESGTGKDVTARAIHSISDRKNADLVIVNCGAIPEGIIESELCGHEKDILKRHITAPFSLMKLPIRRKIFR